MSSGKIKYLLLTAVLLISAAVLRAQDAENPVRWTASSEEIGNGVFRIHFTAKIQNPWHMYDIGPYEGGPNATTFTFAPNPQAELQGTVRQKTKPTRVFDPLFDMEIGYFAGKAEFTQDVKLNSGGET